MNCNGRLDKVTFTVQLMLGTFSGAPIPRTIYGGVAPPLSLTTTPLDTRNLGAIFQFVSNVH